MRINTANFTLQEFECRCGCKKNEISQTVIEMCQKIRDRLKEPIHINSGYRCPKHNAEVGGVPNSYHAQGLAADLSCRSGARVLFALIADMKARGELPELSYAIMYSTKNFVHIDSGKGRSKYFEIRP